MSTSKSQVDLKAKLPLQITIYIPHHWFLIWHISCSQNSSIWFEIHWLTPHVWRRSSVSLVLTFCFGTALTNFDFVLIGLSFATLTDFLERDFDWIYCWVDWTVLGTLTRFDHRSKARVWSEVDYEKRPNWSHNFWTVLTRLDYWLLLVREYRWLRFDFISCIGLVDLVSQGFDLVWLMVVQIGLCISRWTLID